MNSQTSVKHVYTIFIIVIVSRVVPYKKETILVKNAEGKKECCCIRVMEMSLLKAYKRYCVENPGDQ